MPIFSVPEKVTVEEFFTKHLPEQFPALIAGANMSALAGKEFQLQYDVEGKKYCLVIKDGKSLSVVPGGVPKPVLEISVPEADWRAAVTGKLEGVMDRFMNPAQMSDANLVEAVKSVKGNLLVDLKKDDGSEMLISMVFNGESEPKVRIKLSVADWVGMQNKQVDGQTLVMSGRMSFDGDMMFLMGLQKVVGQS